MSTRGWRKGLLVAGIILLAAVSGCGYTTRSLVAEKYDTVYIPAFKNSIDISRESTSSNYRLYRPMLESDITAAVTQKFLIDGNLKPVDKREDADLVLEGTLIDFRKDALAYTSNDDVNEYRVSIVVSLVMSTASDARVIWREPSFTGYTTYFLSGAQAGSESAAINDAIRDLSRRIVERTVDAW